MRSYAICVIVEVATLLTLCGQGLEEDEIVRSAFRFIPIATSIALIPLIIGSTYSFFQKVDYRNYRPFHWNPNPQFQKTSAAVRSSIAAIAIALLLLLLPQGLFLLLIDEYHALTPTYFVLLVFAGTVAYVAPIMATVGLISSTALTTIALKKFVSTD